MRINYSGNTHQKIDLCTYSQQERLGLQTLLENKVRFMFEICQYLDITCRWLPERNAFSKSKSVVVVSLNDFRL
jgi:hypothetical protein